MVPDESLTIRALTALLKETLFRADPRYGYLLNSGDSGFVETLKPITATQASALPGEDRRPIVSHANHILYSIELANRALNGDSSAYLNADWSAAWELESVDDQQWQQLKVRCEQEAHLLIEHINQPQEWTELTLTGSLSIPAHVAYHLGSIRQILLDVTKS